MNKRVKNFLIVTLVSFLLAGTCIFLSLNNPELDSYKNIYVSILKFCGDIVMILYAFFIVPAFIYALNYAKRYLEKLDVSQSFRLGYFFGELFFVLIILATPVFGFLWYLGEIKEFIVYQKNKNNEK